MIAVASTLVALVTWLGASALRMAARPDRPVPVERLLEAEPEVLSDAIAAAGLPNNAFESLESERPVYRYSVVPGGTYDAAELRRAVASDRVVAAHYSKLDTSRVHTETVTHDRYVHVSYRKGNEIFWTKKKVLLRKGETILTDGTTQVRTRCGNCISEEPLGPTAADEPEVVEFDRLVDAAAPTAEVPPAADLTVAGDSTRAGLSTGQSAPTSAPTASGAAMPSGGGVVPFRGVGGVSGGSPDVPPVVAKRSGTREPSDTPDDPSSTEDGSTPPGNPQGPGSSSDEPGIQLPPLTDLTFPPGGNHPPNLDELFPGPGQPNGPNGFGPTSENPPILTGDEPANPVPVPEPGTLMLLGGGVAALIRRRLRSRSQ